MPTSKLLPRGSTGIHVPIEPDGAHRRAARDLEQLGYDTLWIAGGELDRLSRATELLEATTSARVATGIVPFGRIGTTEIGEFTRDAGPRFVLGLGGPQQPRALKALHGHLDQLDAAGIGPDRRLLAALGPRKLQIAAERAGGAITLLTTPEFTAAARAQLGPSAILAVHEYVVPDTDAERARAAARKPVGFLARIPGYRANLSRMGFTEDDIETLSDRMIDHVVARGNPAEIAERISRHRAAGADHVNLAVLGTEGTAGLRAAAAALANELALT